MKLLVRNLAKATTEDKLISLFSEHGKVQSCNVVLDGKTGKSKGFGFIEMPNPGEAKAAMKTLNGFKLAGNIIRVKKADAKMIEPEKVENNTTTSVQFKQATKTPVAKKQIPNAPQATDNNSEEIIDNNDNIANIYGKIKQSEDY